MKTFRFKAVLLAFFCFLTAFGQQRVAKKVTDALHRQKAITIGDILSIDPSAHAVSRPEKTIAGAAYFSFNTNAAKALIGEKSKIVTLKIPTADNTFIILDLLNYSDFYQDMEVITSSGKKYEETPHSAFFRGIVRGHEDNSIAAINIFENEISGIIGMPDKNLVLGKIDKSQQHILYDDKNMGNVPMAACGTTDPDHAKTEPVPYGQTARLATDICVKIHYETEYDMFAAKGSVANVVDFVKGAHNQVAIIYDNIGVNLAISSMKVWDTADPYDVANTNSAVTTFNDFQSYTSSINGNIGQLLTFRNMDLGLGVQVMTSANLCDSAIERLSVVPLQNGYNDYPTYSRTVLFMAHETGHMLGSPHTHACVWNGNGTAIDNCGAILPGITEGDACITSPPTIPPGITGGTIMSYCHISPNPGILLTNGFGSQPEGRILAVVNGATCLQQCCQETYETAYSDTVGALVVQEEEASQGIYLEHTIEPSGTGIYHAGEVIVLENKFHAKSGSRFWGYIDFCDGLFNSRPSHATVTPGIKDTASLQDKLIFDPSSQSVTINNERKIVMIRLFSIDGKLMLAKPVDAQPQFNFSTATLAKGIYILQMETADGKITSEKFFK